LLTDRTAFCSTNWKRCAVPAKYRRARLSGGRISAEEYERLKYMAAGWAMPGCCIPRKAGYASGFSEDEQAALVDVAASPNGPVLEEPSGGF
jgi:hypothetical protein